MFKSVLMVATVLVLAGCQTTNSKLETIAKQGTVVDSEYVAANGRVTVPLPQGEWIVAGADYVRAGKYDNPIEEVMLVQVRNNVAVAAVQIRSSVAYSSNGFARSKFCERTNILYLNRVTNVAGKMQDCWGINHYAFKRSDDMAPHMKQAENFIVSRKIEAPVISVGVNFEIADRGYFLEALYLFNPEDGGFGRPKPSEWLASDWHRDRVYMDPDKVAYIDKLKAWGREWYPKVKAGFEGS